MNVVQYIHLIRPGIGVLALLTLNCMQALSEGILPVDSAMSLLLEGSRPWINRSSRGNGSTRASHAAASRAEIAGLSPILSVDDIDEEHSRILSRVRPQSQEVFSAIHCSNLTLCTLCPIPSCLQVCPIRQRPLNSPNRQWLHHPSSLAPTS
jgi:hypothetical protein